MLISLKWGVHVIPTTLVELKKRFEEKLQMPVCLNNAYKLCDYKPMYGVVFDDYLKEFDFWGHCDTDMIFGDIRQMITDDLLSRYDRILTRGHLSLYRNIDEVNHFFMRSEKYDRILSWKEIVMSEKNHVFDEWSGVSRMWKDLNNDRMYDEVIYDDISTTKKHFISYQKQARNMDTGMSHFIFEYTDGNLYRWHYDDNTREISKEPTLYAHFQKRDMQQLTTDTQRYLIIPNRFIAHQGITMKDVLSYGKKHFFYLKYYKMRWNNLKRKLFG